MIVPYIDVDKVIHSSKGEFMVIETYEQDGIYSLLDYNTKKVVAKSNQINDFRRMIGKIKKIVKE